jgi:RND family efflux transporter MFP subunit
MRLPPIPFSASLALLALAGCGGPSEVDERPSLATIEVRAITVESASIHHHQPLPGTVHPVEQAAVAAKLMATVEEASFAIGQRVSAGEILVRLRADELDARREQAAAGLARVRRNFERESALLAQGATTAETVRNLEDELRLAEARLAEAETMLTYTVVKAPFDGIITTKNVRRGDLATPGLPLLTLEGDGVLRVHVQVPDSLTLIEMGDVIPLDSRGERLHGTLVEWSPAADPASRTRLAKLELPASAPVRSGQYVRVLWPASHESVLWAPRDAVARRGQIDQVFAIDEGTARLRIVKLGLVQPDRVQILAGLEPGESVVLAAPVELRDGQPVTLAD